MRCGTTASVAINDDAGRLAASLLLPRRLLLRLLPIPLPLSGWEVEWGGKTGKEPRGTVTGEGVWGLVWEPWAGRGFGALDGGSGTVGDGFGWWPCGAPLVPAGCSVPCPCGCECGCDEWACDWEVGGTESGSGAGLLRLPTLLPNRCPAFNEPPKPALCFAS